MISSKTRAELWGVYSAKYRVLTTMPIAIASSLSTAIVPAMVRILYSKRQTGNGEQSFTGIKVFNAYSFPLWYGIISFRWTD